MKKYFTERTPVSPELMASYNDGSHTKQYPTGTVAWYKNGELHRDGDMPAKIYARGRLEWYKNGLQHRDDDKPAVISADDLLVWYKNDKLHRSCGPALIRPNNQHQYWINDVNITTDVEAWLKSRKYKAPFTPEQQVEFALTFS